MAPFSKRQIGYIKAVAGVGQHKSFVNYSNAAQTYTTLTTDPGAPADYPQTRELVQFPQTTLTPFTTTPLGSYDPNGKRMAGIVFCMNDIPLTVDHTDTSEDLNAHEFRQRKFSKFLTPNKMQLLSQGCYPEGDEPREANTAIRVGEDFYLESTHIRWRFTMPDFSVASGKQPHHEYRFIVFRQRKPTLQRGSSPTGDSAQWLNWNYDLFSGYHGRRVGFSGSRYHEEMDGKETYIDMPITHVTNNEYVSVKLSTDDFMTLPVNDADYVVMRDERFFLGAEHGKSHFETVTRFDWSDQGSGSEQNLVPHLDDGKNYDWWFLLIGTTNDDVVPQLNVSVRGTTAITSA